VHRDRKAPEHTHIGTGTDTKRQTQRLSEATRTGGGSFRVIYQHKAFSLSLPIASIDSRPPPSSQPSSASSIGPDTSGESVMRRHKHFFKPTDGSALRGIPARTVWGAHNLRRAQFNARGHAIVCFPACTARPPTGVQKP